MRNLIVLAVAASTVTFWLSSKDRVENTLPAPAPLLAPVAAPSESLAFSQAWPAFGPSSDPLQSAAISDTAPPSTPGASQPTIFSEKFVDEAELRRVTELEIARMKAFGIGMDADGAGPMDAAQASSSLEASGLSFSADAR